MSLDPLLLLCRAHRLPLPECEVAFIEGRKFRADYLWRSAMVILEQDGSIWTKGGHSTGKGILRDMEKGNLAQLAGFVFLRCTPSQITSGEILPILREALLPAGGQEAQP